MGGNQHLATHVTAFFNCGQLVFKVHTGSTRGNHVFHQFKCVQHAAETSFCIGHDRQEVVDEIFAAGLDAAAPLDFISALEGVIDAADHGGYRIVGVQGLIRVHGLRRVAVCGHLPTR